MDTFSKRGGGDGAGGQGGREKKREFEIPFAESLPKYNSWSLDLSTLFPRGWGTGTQLLDPSPQPSRVAISRKLSQEQSWDPGQALCFERWGAQETP